MQNTTNYCLQLPDNVAKMLVQLYVQYISNHELSIEIRNQHSCYTICVDNR
jgi:hypothetical protein